MATRRQAQRAIELHEEKLAKYPNVTGLGVVPAKGAEGSGDMAVGVYVTKKVPRRELEAGERIPRTLEIPAREGTREVPTEVVEAGPFEPEDRIEQDQTEQEEFEEE